MAAESGCEVIVRDFIASRLAKTTACDATQSVLLMAQICGSASFNLNVATSDTDYFGVYAASLRSLFQLKGPVDTLDAHTPHDICVYELAHFCRLLLKGNPKLIEPIFLKQGAVFRGPEWEQLFEQGHRLLTATALQQYIAFGFSQLKRTDEATAPKKLYHALRLGFEAQRIVAGKPPSVWISGAERDYIMAVRLGNEDASAAEAKARSTLSEVEGLDTAHLPSMDEATAVLNEWNYQVRAGQYGSGAYDELKTETWAQLLTPATESTDVNVDRLAALIPLTADSIGVVAVCVSGSVLHGLATAADVEARSRPVDRVVVYVTSNRSLLRVDVSQRLEKPSLFTEGSGDLFIEVGQLCALLSLGNHRAVECVEQDAPLFSTRAWQSLRRARHGLRSRTQLANLLGLASKFANKRASADDLAARELLLGLRFLAQAQRLMDGESIVGVGDAEAFRSLSDVPVDELRQLLQSRLAEAKSREQRCQLPKKVDLTPVDEWLVGLRLAAFEVVSRQ